MNQIQDEIRRLNARSESLQQQLVAKNSGFSQAKESALLRPEDIQKALPPKSALVDFIEYGQYPRLAPGKAERTPERRLLAFVVRPDGPIHKVDLGPADLIQDKVARWTREVIGRRDSDGTEFGRNCGSGFGNRWSRFGSGRNGRRFARRLALPVSLLCSARRKPGSYLARRRRLAVIPVPRLLPQLLAQSYTAADEKVSAASLLIGDVDYESDPGTIHLAQNDVRDRSREPVNDRGGGRLEFRYLPGTKQEMEAIDQLYRRNFPGQEPHLLAGLEATEQAFRDQAPGIAASISPRTAISSLLPRPIVPSRRRVCSAPSRKCGHPIQACGRELRWPVRTAGSKPIRARLVNGRKAAAG